MREETASENPGEQRHPLTPEQREETRSEIAEIKARLAEMATLMRACFGDADQVTVRAEEVCAAVERFEWELERTRQNTQSGTLDEPRRQ